MLELLNSYLLSHMFCSIVKKEVFYVFIIHRLIYLSSESVVDTTFGQRGAEAICQLLDRVVWVLNPQLRYFLQIHWQIF